MVDTVADSVLFIAKGIQERKATSAKIQRTKERNRASMSACGSADELDEGMRIYSDFALGMEP